MTLPTPESEALTKLNTLLEQHAITIFSEAEARALKRVAVVYQGLESMSHLGGYLVATLKAIGYLVAAYVAIKAGVVDFIRSAVMK